MIDNKIIKANESNSVIQKEKIKAIYPHIVVSGKKPYYSIHWYDVKQQKMICGFSSYKLNFVRKWLQEEFEIVDDDIENIINRLPAENENSIEKKFPYCVLCGNAAILTKNLEEYDKLINNISAEAIKEFAEILKDVWFDDGYDSPNIDFDDFIDNIVKKVVGEE